MARDNTIVGRVAVIALAGLLAYAAKPYVAEHRAQKAQVEQDRYAAAYEEGYNRGYEEGEEYGFAMGQIELSGEISSDLENLTYVTNIIEDYRNQAISYWEMYEAVEESQSEIWDLWKYYDNLPAQIYDDLGIKPYVFDPDDLPSILGTPEDSQWEMQDTPNSTCFSSVGYDRANKELHVIFRNSGKEYIYSKFSEKDWNIFINADSLGGHYNMHIKGKYPSTKVE